MTKGSADFAKEILELNPGATVDLFELDLKGQGTYLFHAGENGYRRKLIFGGREYGYVPINVEGFEVAGDGRLPRPRLSLGNEGGIISSKLPFFEDFLGHKFTRIKTFVKYLDADNFPSSINPHERADSTVEFPREVFFVNQKLKENKNVVEFELVSILELETAKIPARTVMCNYCFWTYRSPIGCGYGGMPVATNKNKRFVKGGYDDPNFIGEETYLGDKPLSPAYASKIPTWDPDQLYKEGDIVRIENNMDDSPLNPDSYYVCITNDIMSDPRSDAENWVRDACSKNVGGCRLRFGENAPSSKEDDSGLPFGGFPGTERFGY